MKRIAMASLLVGSVLVIAVHAEVSDKVPPQSSLVVFGLISGFACFLSARLKPWTVILVAPVPVGYFVFLFADFWLADLEPDILNEMGSGYVLSGCVSAALIPAGIMLGLAVRYFKRNPTQRGDRG